MQPVQRILQLSLIANAILVAWLLSRSVSEERAPSSEPGPIAIRAAAAAPRSPHSRNDPPADGSTRGLPLGSLPDWRDLESTDYQHYIANLRHAGIPEDIVTDLIIADLRKTFVPRALAILGPQQAPPYWVKWQPPQPTTEQLRQLGGLEREEQTLLSRLLGHSFSLQPLVDRLFLQVDSHSLALDFLPPERLAAAQDALAQASVRHRELNDPDLAYQNSPESDQRRLDLRLEALRGVLTPEELADYRARLLPANSTLGQRTRVFEVTEDEYRRLLELEEHRDPNSSPAAHQAEITTLLGTERAQLYEKAGDWMYLHAREAAARYGLPEQVADEAFALRQAAEADAARIRDDPQLDANTKQQRSRELRERTESQLRTRLGKDGFTLVSGFLSWLDQIAPTNPPTP